MRRHRRWTLVLTLVLSLVGAACAQAASPPPGTTPSPTPTTPTETTPSPTFTTLEEGILRVGSCLDFPPFEFVEAGEEKGFDVDLTEEIASRLGLQVQWVRADFDTIFTALAANDFDMVAAAVTATGDVGAQRDQVVDFSDYYFNAGQSLAVNVQRTPDIKSVDDLQPGDIIGVQRGTTGKDWAEENLAPRGIEIKTYRTITPAFADLEAGAITGIVNDAPSSEGIIERQQLTGVVEVVQFIDTGEKYAFAFSEDNPGLREAVNRVLREIIADGTYAEIWERWFPQTPLPEEYRPTS